MPISLVRYSAEYSINGLKRWISCEATVLDENDSQKEMDKSALFCDDTFKRLHGNQGTVVNAQFAESAILPVTPVEKVIEDFKALSIPEQIESCKSPTVLKIYKGMLKTESDKLAYDNKMNELLNQPITNGK